MDATSKSRSRLCLAAIVAILALPSAANAEYLVPPGNSAATQYTETVPTAGGQRNAEKGRGRAGRTPEQVLGSDDANKLERHGDDGREVAELAAETAPVEVEAPVESTPAGDDATPSQGDERDEPDEDSTAPAAGGPDRGTPAASGREPAAASLPDGSSGAGEVIAEATGLSSSAGLLPLALLATLAWALAFLWRQRQRPTA